METNYKKRRRRDKRVSYLNLHTVIPQKDIRLMIYKQLDKYDMKMVQMAHNSKKKIDRLEMFASYCAEMGYLSLLEWLLNNSDKHFWKDHVCKNAAVGGHINVLQWARQNGFKWDKWTCAYAALGGHLHVLQWARENGCDWNSYTCTYAAQGGHLNVLQWARENGCNWDSDTCAYAARGGHLNVLQWARENGCDWCSWTCWLGARGGHLKVLQWAVENGCDINLNECLNRPLEYNVRKYLLTLL